MSYPYYRRCALVTALLAAPVVQAHPLADHVAAWQAFVHPFSGADHVIAMLVIGLWAGLSAPTRRLLPPASFLGGLMVGAALGACGAALSAVGTGIALSVLVLGPLAARAARLPAMIAALVCVTAGVFHGHAHGVELGGLGAAGAAFMLGSMLLHGLGYALARRLDTGRHAHALRVALSASGVFGLALLWMA